MKEMSWRFCPSCGKVIGKDVSICPNCKQSTQGENIQQDTRNLAVRVQPVVNKPAKKTDHKRKIIVTGAVVAIILIVFIFLVNQNNNNRYGENVTVAIYTMIDGATDAENAGNLIVKVWNNAIFDRTNPETSEYTSGTSDFNGALQNLFSDGEFLMEIESIKNNQRQVRDLMQSLSNPPKGYITIYADLMSCYDAYLEFTNLVINPTGNLREYSSSFHSADSRSANALERILIYIE